MKRVITAAILSLSFVVAIVGEVSAQSADQRATYRLMLDQSKTKRAEAERLARSHGWPIRVIDPKDRIMELQEVVGGMPQYFVTCNVNAARTTRTDSVQHYIGGGSGFGMTMWDGGHARQTHVELGGRVFVGGEEMYSPQNHATHVGGTMIAAGVAAQAKGMAYQAGLVTYNWNDDMAEMGLQAMLGLLISNHSYAYIRGWHYAWDDDAHQYFWYWYGDVSVSTTEDYRFGFYDSRAHAIDSMTAANPNYLPVFSASNDRLQGPPAGTGHYYMNPVTYEWIWSTAIRDLDGAPDGYDCLPNGNQTAKNLLVVGAVKDVPNYTGPSDVVLCSFSSCGPTDDGRIKPDVVANGDSLYSSMAYNTQGDPSDTSYGWGSGTSMSAPNVTGSLALLQKYYKDQHAGTAMKAATLKALAIHTAREAGPGPGPDYQFGWGLLDAYGAYQLLAGDPTGIKGWIRQATLSNGVPRKYFYYCDGTAPELKVTICWNDPPGTPPAKSLDPTNQMLKNDLDIRVTRIEGSTYSPWVLDPANPEDPATTGDNGRDNVEQVRIANPTRGYYRIDVTHKGTLVGGSQDYSVIVSGGTKRSAVWLVKQDGTGDFTNITDALHYSNGEDAILVYPGTYTEYNLQVNKQLDILGLRGPDSTIVDCQSLGRSFEFVSTGEGSALEGFSLRNGNAPAHDLSKHGGALYCNAASVTVTNCVIEDSHADNGGGGICFDTVSPTLVNCRILGNSTDSYGGGIEGRYSDAVLDSCVIAGNSAGSEGGGVFCSYGAPEFTNCTISHNSTPGLGGGVYVGMNGYPWLTNTIISFSTDGRGIYGDGFAFGAAMSCCDVYGNADGNYGGSVPDKTGILGNISQDPMFCDGAGGDYHIYDASPCAPANNSCAVLIGRFGVDCLWKANLVIASVSFPETHPYPGEFISGTVKVKNIGPAPASAFFIDYYANRASAPPGGSHGDERQEYFTLASGDSVTWTTSPGTVTTFLEWLSYFRVDTDNMVSELNENDNLSGPHHIYWQIPSEPGWPAGAGGNFHSSPAVASLDDDPTTLDVVIGADDGKLYAWGEDGTAVSGWPVTVGDSLKSSPAVGDIAGDYHNEVVVGCKNGKLYAYDYHGAKLWEYATANPVDRTPVLADLDKNGKAEVVFSSGGSLYALRGNGSVYTGWPYSAAPGGTFTSPTVGDVDGDGALEIAAIAYGYLKPVHSNVYLLRANGTIFSGSWPASVDTAVVADPVLGDVLSPSTDLEIVTGGMNGKVYVWKTNATLWPSLPRVSGMIETSPALANLDKGDALLEIVVTSRRYVALLPPHWEGIVTAIDNTGAIMPKWPRSPGTWIPNVGPAPSAIIIGSGDKIMEGGPACDLHAWYGDGDAAYGFPIDVTAGILTSAAAGDLDGDDWLELIVAGTDDSVHCFELCSTGYDGDELWWPMFRHDRARTGCYGFVVPTAVEEGGKTTPTVTCIRSIYPNPFNPMTRVTFDVEQKGLVKLAVYDVAGRSVATLVDGQLDAGRYNAVWNGRTLGGRIAASGVYFCRLESAGTVETKKVVLIR